MKNNLLADLYPDIAKEWDSSKNSINLSTITYGVALKVWWICEYGHSFQQKVNNRTASNQGCPYCSGAKPVIGVTDLTTTHPELAREWSQLNTRKVTEVSKGSDYEAIWDVASCGHTYKSRVSRRVAGHGCSVCAGFTVISGVNDLEFCSPELASEWDYELNFVSPSRVLFRSSNKYHWVCRRCSHKWETSVRSRVILGTGCPKCVDINQPKVVDVISKILNVNETNVRLDGIKWPTGQRLEVDMLLGGDTVVEYDGDYWHMNKKDVDTRKTKILLDAGYKVIRLREKRVALLDIHHINFKQVHVVWSLDEEYWANILEDIV